MIEKFKKAVPILEKIEEQGYEAYFVGGSVRDFILQREIDDVDIATSAFPDEIKAIFPKTIDVGIKHGTVVVVYQGESYEVTTFRTDGEYTDYRRPKEVTFVRSLIEDLQRRDFTMNAIAMTKEGELIDPFRGQEDIKDNIIRTVGKPEERFKEDALRIMRAIRFVSQLSFRLHDETFFALKTSAPLLTHISIERIYIEFTKLLLGRNRGQALQYLVDRELHPYLPGLSPYKTGLLTFAKFINHVHLSEIELWALLLVVVEEKSVEPFLRKWKMSVKMIRDIQKIIQAYRFRVENHWTKEAVYYTGREICLSTERLYSLIHHIPSEENLSWIHNTYQLLPIKNRADLAVTGNDLITWSGKQSGPWIKQVLETVEKAVINEIIANEKRSIKEWLYT